MTPDPRPASGHSRRRTVVAGDGVPLAVHESGPADAPTVVLVHGYPDDHHVWDGVVAELATDLHVVAYDVRGAGDSGVPTSRRGYRIEQLVDDLRCVVDVVSPGAPVHLVAHDWGSIQCWDALTAATHADRFASYTSISGPSLDHASAWFRRLGEGPVARLRQLAASYYIALFMLPVLPELAARHGLVGRLVEHSASLARPAVLPPTAEQHRTDAETVHGIELYRANVPGRLARPRPPVVDVPVQVLVADHDVHVSPRLAAEAAVPYAADLTVHQIEGNHWVVAQRPDVVAAHVRSAVAAHPAGLSP